jgi:hypothetical protein
MPGQIVEEGRKADAARYSEDDVGTMMVIGPQPMTATEWEAQYCTEACAEQGERSWKRCTKTNLANMRVDSPTAMAPQSSQLATVLTAVKEALDLFCGSSNGQAGSRSTPNDSCLLTSVIAGTLSLDHIQRKKPKSMSRMITAGGTPSSQRRLAWTSPA